MRQCRAKARGSNGNLWCATAGVARGMKTCNVCLANDLVPLSNPSQCTHLLEAVDTGVARVPVLVVEVVAEAGEGEKQAELVVLLP